MTEMTPQPTGTFKDYWAKCGTGDSHDRIIAEHAYFAGTAGEREKLKPYVQHKPECEEEYDEDGMAITKCTCGFHALDTALAPRPPREET